MAAREEGPADPQQVRRLFELAQSQPPEQRSRFVHEQANGDTNLARAVLDLLANAGSTALLWQAAQQTLAAATDRSVPEQLGPYRILGELSHGGMGVVYHAQRTDNDQQVAIKVPRLPLGLGGDPVRQRFATEQRLLAAMSHRCIAKVFDAGVMDSGQPFFVMEYLPGQPLHDYCAQRRLPVDARLRLFQQVCEGVQHAHSKAVVHRDLKPGNILVVEEDGVPVPKVLDFGVAKLLQIDGDTPTVTVTKGDGVLGTPCYLSPEQALGRNSAVDTRSDVYALGVILYELLTGTLPVPEAELQRIGDSSGLPELYRHIAEHMPPRPSVRALQSDRAATDRAPAPPTPLARQLRGDLDRIAMQAMAKEPEQRYQTALALAEDIGRHLRHEPVTAMPPRPGYLLRRFVRRHRLAVGAAAAMALGIGVAGASAWWSAREVARSEQEARRSDAAVLVQSAQAAFRGGDWQRTLDLLQRAEQIGPVDMATATALRVRALMFEARMQEARAALGTVPDQIVAASAVLLVCRAELDAHESDDPDTGRALFEQALASGQLDDTEAAYVRAQLATDLQQMERELLTVLRAEPSHLPARQTLQGLFLLQGRAAELGILLQEMRVLHPKETSAELLLPWLRQATSASDPKAAARLRRTLPRTEASDSMLAGLPRFFSRVLGLGAQSAAKQTIFADYSDDRKLALEIAFGSGSLLAALKELGAGIPKLHFAAPLRRAVPKLDPLRTLLPSLTGPKLTQLDRKELSNTLHELSNVIADPIVFTLAMLTDPELEVAPFERRAEAGRRLLDACRLHSGPLHALPGGRRVALLGASVAMADRRAANDHEGKRTATDGTERSYRDDLLWLVDTTLATPELSPAELLMVGRCASWTDPLLEERLYSAWELHHPNDGVVRFEHAKMLSARGEQSRALALAEEASAVWPDHKPLQEWLANQRPAAGAK